MSVKNSELNQTSLVTQVGRYYFLTGALCDSTDKVLKDLSFCILLEGVPDQLQTKLLKFSYARIQTEPEHQTIGNREKVMIRQERGL